MGLKYLGSGFFIGVPARDLGDVEVKLIAEALNRPSLAEDLVRSGLYALSTDSGNGLSGLGNGSLTTELTTDLGSGLNGFGNGLEEGKTVVTKRGKSRLMEIESKRESDERESGE